MKIKVQDLTEEQLDEWVARAQGWSKFRNEDCQGTLMNIDWVLDGTGIFKIACEDYSPTTNDAQAVALVKEFLIDITWMLSHNVMTRPMKVLGAPQFVESGKDLDIAICRAAIAAKFGEVVEVEDED